jgi:dimeric dUTPase (all-alpha-NTP-PPase superfamily)
MKIDKLLEIQNKIVAKMGAKEHLLKVQVFIQEKVNQLDIEIDELEKEYKKNE